MGEIKYHYLRVIIVIAQPKYIRLPDVETNGSMPRFLLERLNDGYEIVTALPVSCAEFAGTEYIIRRKLNNENDKNKTI